VLNPQPVLALNAQLGPRERAALRPLHQELLALLAAHVLDAEAGLDVT
jgi:hypothetical protein